MFLETTGITSTDFLFVYFFGVFLLFLNDPFDDFSAMKGTVGFILGPLDHI